MAMMKTARAYTGKPKIAKAEGAYHGTYDFAEISQSPNPSNWGDIDRPNSVPLSYGTPQGVLDDMVIFPFNDLERTINILEQNKDKLAGVLFDLVPHRVGLVPGENHYIKEVYNWTRQNDVLLLFDEVITFRVSYGGAQDNYSVRPDITALGKIIGGGFPVGAFAGRSEVMKVLDPGEKKLLFPFSGTFSANPVTTTAGRVAMELYDREAVRSINSLTAMAKAGIEEAAKIADVPVCLTGAGSMFRFHPKPDAPKNFREAYQPAEVSALISEILDYMFYTEKIMLINTVSCMFSTAITRKEIDILSQAFLNMFRLFKPKIDKIQ